LKASLTEILDWRIHLSHTDNVGNRTFRRDDTD
jgi:hypothetical protein